MGVSDAALLLLFVICELKMFGGIDFQGCSRK